MAFESSDHDTQKFIVAGYDRDDFDDGSLTMDIRHPSQCPAGPGSSPIDNVVLLIHLFIYAFGCLSGAVVSAA
jgi:hypothetical protein